MNLRTFNIKIVSIVSLGFLLLLPALVNAASCPGTTANCCPRVEIELFPRPFCLKEEIIRAAAGEGSGYIITQCDIPLVINCPGKYSVAQDINFSSGTAITINASQVTLEMNDHTINGGGPGGFIGILVNPNLQNIDIQNGSVIGTFSTAIVFSPHCSNITLDHVTANSNGFVGAEIQQGCQDISIKNSQFNYNLGSGLLIREGAVHVLIDSIDGSFNGPFGAALNNNGNSIETTGLSIDGASADIVVRNSNFHDNFSIFATQTVHGRSLTNQVYGALFNRAHDILVENCTFYNMSNVGLATGLTMFGQSSANGIFITQSTIRDCVCYGITSTGSNAIGYQLSANPTDVTFDNCTASNIVGWFEALGISSSFGGDVLITDCVMQNLSLFQTPANLHQEETIGIFCHGNVYTTIRNCVVQNLSMTATAQLTTSLNAVGGIVVQDGGHFICVEDCVVENLVGPCNLVTGYQIQGPAGVSVKNCVALNIVNTSNALTTTVIAAGFATNIDVQTPTGAMAAVGVEFDNCVSGSVFCAINSHGYGFLVNYASAPAVLDCISYGNGVGIGISTLSSQFVQSFTGAVQGNIVYDNTVAGIYDGSINKLGNVVLQNVAYNNANLNYTKDLVTWGLSADTPIRTWSHSTGFPPEIINNLGQTPDTFDNLSIV